MIRPMPLGPANKVQNLLDFQDTVQRGNTFEAMQMQQAPVERMPVQYPTESMARKHGGLVSLPINNRFFGGLVSSVLPAVVGRGVIGAGGGLLGGAAAGALTGYLTNKVLGKETNLKENAFQGLVPAATSYYRGNTNFLPDKSPTAFGATPNGFMGRFGSSLKDQLSTDNLIELATDAALTAGLTSEEIEEEQEQKEKYKGLDLQNFKNVSYSSDNSLDYDPDNRQTTQESLKRRALGLEPRRRFLPRTTYKRTAKEGGLASMVSNDFEGRVPGRSDGMEDDQYYAIREKGGPVEGLLAVSPKEYVIPADVMSILGNGNPDSGANDMDRFTKQVRMEAYGTPNQQKELDGFQTINNNLKG
tara:strand:- start:1465 stop:2544 length:1080 start_codon:yes stop_codon:yes gene_type:complete